GGVAQVGIDGRHAQVQGVLSPAGSERGIDPAALIDVRRRQIRFLPRIRPRLPAVARDRDAEVLPGVFLQAAVRDVCRRGEAAGYADESAAGRGCARFPVASGAHGHAGIAHHVDGAAGARRSGIDVDGARAIGERPGALPAFAPIGRNPERGLAARPHGGVERAGVGGIDGESGDALLRTVGDTQGFVGMVTGHGDESYVARGWIEQLPAQPAIDAAIEPGAVSVQGARSDGVERKDGGAAAEVEHAPVRPAIGGEVGAGHVAGDKDHLGIVRADGGQEHGATAAGSDDAPPRGTGVGARGWAEEKQTEGGEAGEGMERGPCHVPPWKAERFKYLALLSTIFPLIPLFFRLCKTRVWFYFRMVVLLAFSEVSGVQKSEIWRD